jgi:predicted ATPase/Tfp pilus assembly protein PilF
MEADAVAHDRILRSAIEANGGYVFKVIGDAFCAAFPTATGGLNAALQAQRALYAHDWGEEGLLRVRMALHTGAAQEIPGEDGRKDYTGGALDRISWLISAANGGQVVLSPPTEELVEGRLPAGVRVVDMGEQRLIDLAHRERIYLLAAEDLPDALRPLKTLEGTPNNLPSRSGPLIGREHEVKVCRDMLAKPEVRLLTLTGPGGTGKTRLALQVAGELLIHFKDGVFAVGLAPVKDPDLVIPTIAHTLGVRETGGQRLLDTLKDSLRHKQMLLLLDNFEQVLDAAPVVWQLLSEAPQLKALITSRAALRLSVEHEYSVPPMQVPAKGFELRASSQIHRTRSPRSEATPLSSGVATVESVALFVASAQAVRPDFKLTDENAADIAEICRRLEGLPLAIELAAARIRILSPSAMLRRLESMLGLLTGGARNLPARQQTMSDTIEWSYSLLDEHEQALFRRLSVFVRGCTLEVAETIALGDPENGDGSTLAEIGIDILDGLFSLVNESLIRQIESGTGETRYSMLELIREYGLEKLAESGEEEATRRCHANIYRLLAEAAENELRGREQVAWLERLETEHDNLRSALDWYIAQGDTDCALQMAGALWRFWYVRSHFTEGRKWLSDALALPGAEARNAARAKALSGAGNLAYNQADYDLAQSLHEESLSIWEELGNQAGMAAAYNNLAIIARRRDDYALAQSLLEKALVTNKALGNKHWQAINLNNLANVVHDQGDYSGARSLQEESLSIFTTLADDWGAAMSLNDLGKIVFDQGDHAGARALYERSMALQEKLGDRRGIASVLVSLGQIFHAQSDYDKARELYFRGLDMFQDAGDRDGISDVYHNIGQVAFRLGDYAEARRLFEESLTIRQELGDRRNIAESHNSLGLVELAQGDFANARRELEHGLALWRELGNKSAIPRSLNNLGLVAACLGEYDLARQYLEQSLATFREVGDKLGVAVVLLNLGLTSGGQGNYQEAFTDYSESLALFVELGDRLRVATCLLRLAALYSVMSEPERAARLAGAAEALFKQISAPIQPFEMAHYRPALAAAQGQLGEEKFAAAMREGQEMGQERAVAYATGDDQT